MKTVGTARAWHKWRLAVVGLVCVMACASGGTTMAGDEGPAGTGERLRSPGNVTYYVDGERGNDANDGRSAQRAWRSLEGVNGMVFAPGDRVLLRAGTRYAGQLVLHGSGKEGRPIVVDRYGEDGRPRIDGEGEFGETVLLRNGEHWEIRNLEITNTGPTPKPHRSGVTVDIVDFGTAHHICLEKLYVHDVNSSNVKGEGGAGIVWHNGGERVKSRFDGLLIQGCHLVRTDRNGIVGWSDYWARDRWHPSLHVVIRGNVLEDIGGDGIVPIGCDGCVIEHNVLRGGRMRAPDYAAGIWPWSCDSTVVQFNEVSGMKGTRDGQGFDADWNCRNTVIQYNYSHDNEGGFALICNDGSSRPPWSAGNQRPVVRYNISQNDGERTFQISAVSDALICNNTIYVRKGMEVCGALFHSWSGWAQGTRLYNNIFYVEGRMRWDLGESTDTVFRNNVFYGRQENPPDDQGKITADPMLRRPGSGGKGFSSLAGYKLRRGSPCIGGGMMVPDNGGRDFWGNAVPAGRAPDVGAQQFRGG